MSCKFDLFLGLAFTVMVFLAVEHGPTIGNDNEAAADLHNRKGDSEEGQDMRTDQKGSNQQDEAVHRHGTGKDSASGGGVLPGQSEKNRTAAEGIHDRKQGAEDQQVLWRLPARGSSGEESIA